MSPHPHPHPRRHARRRRVLLSSLAAGALGATALVGTGATGNAAPPPAPAASEPGAIETVSSGWTIPWGLAWLPDGSALIGERDDFTVAKLTRDGTRTEIGTVPEVVTTGGEGGLLGIAVPPDLEADPHVYVMHSAEEGNRIARMDFDGSSLSGYEVVLDGIAKARYHNGGRIAFGPDGYLYATTGDALDTALAQDPEALEGKILRMTTAGEPAPGNPTPDSLVYSLGHRNPQGLTWDDEGRLWSAEFGQNTFDELNLVKPGANYGWPVCEGRCGKPGFTDPKRQWPVNEASPSAVAYADGAIYMAALRGERLWRIPLLDGERTGKPRAFYVSDYGRLRTVAKLPGENALWLTTTNADANGGQGPDSDKVFQVTLQ